ncbi:MAG: adenylate/guanylate cyclase domain-containing protein, partial [Zetaproteobacteria bacterium]
VRFSEKQWHELVAALVTRILLASMVVVLLSGIFVFWLAGRMSRPLEKLAEAAKRVAAGDYTVKLPVIGYNEIADATRQFNEMVKELAHKEELRNVFGRYLNPKLVSEVFDGDGRKLEGSQREVTVLFADMVGFTSFAESTKTEQVIEVLNTYFGVFHRIIDHFGGHVDKYIGDAVMAVFNHPKDDKAHARHAAMAALAMAEACHRLKQPRPDGGRIQFRMGLNCGEVIVGNIGADERLQYTVIGNAVNVASRVCSLGDGGQVIVPLATFERMGAGFAFDSIGDRMIKGVREPLPCGMIRAMAADVREQIEAAVNAAFKEQTPAPQGTDA